MKTPMRDKNGFCIRCAPGQKGELLGKIDNSDPTRNFDVCQLFFYFYFTH